MSTNPRVIALMTFLLLSGLIAKPALGDIILSYTVPAWNEGNAISGTTLDGAAFSNTLTLQLGTPQSAVLFPVTVSIPDDYGFSGEGLQEHLSVSLGYQDTVTGAQGTFNAVFDPLFGISIQNTGNLFISSFLSGSFEFDFPDFQLTVSSPAQYYVLPAFGTSATFNIPAVFSAVPVPVPNLVPELGTGELTSFAALLVAAYGMRRLKLGQKASCASRKLGYS